jgi:hypothetical protein
MTDNNLVPAPSHPENNQSIIEPPPQKPSAVSASGLEPSTLADAIIDNLTLLAVAYNEPLTPERIEVYTLALAGLTPEQLHHGFNRAIRELKFWPRPAELLEMCTGCASAMTDKLTIDLAWNWTRNYIEAFEVPPQRLWKLQGVEYHGDTIDGAIRRKRSGEKLAMTAPYYALSLLEVPPLPELISQTLVGMAGSVKMGLTRIKDAMRGWDSKAESGVSGKDAAFVRKDFDEYCSRAIAAARSKTPSSVTPGLQLTGEVSPSFPPPTPTRIAVRIERKWNECKVYRLGFGSAKSLFDGGKLPQPLYEEALLHHEQIQRQEQLMNTPLEYAAIYLSSHEPPPSPLDEEPWPTMGRFRIEDANGSKVVIDDLAMAVGDLKLTSGQILRFSAKPKELVFEVYPRQFFNLNEALTIHKEG